MPRSIQNIVPKNGGLITKVDANIGREAYFTMDGLNASSLTAGIDKDMFYPLHTKHAYEDESESVGDHFDFGTLGHMICFEPARVKTDVSIWTGGRRAGKAWDQFVEDNKGKLIVKEQTYNDTLEALMPLISLAEFRQHTGSGSAEVALFGEFKGLQLRGQLDWISQSEGSHWDLKTSRDIRPEPFGRQFFSLHYDMKMAFYRELLRQNGLDLNSHNIAAIRNKKPWDAILYPIPEEVLDRGWAKMEELLDVCVDCHAAEMWPGAGLGNAWGDLVIPYYAMTEQDQVDWGK
jgi:hypothetical protein